MNPVAEVLVVGGGVVGLTAAWEFARRGWTCMIVDRSEPGREASWAGAGILSPAKLGVEQNDFERLRAESFARYPQIADELLERTGVDPGFLRCGGLDLAVDAEECIRLEDAARTRRAQGILCEEWTVEDLRRAEPALSVPPGAKIFSQSEGCQIRNPRLMRGLVGICRLEGVQLELGEVETLRTNGERVEGVRLRDGRSLLAAHTVVAAGAWVRELLLPLGLDVPVEPVRGQILALETAPGTLHRTIEIGKRYLVPRADGLVLVGSTEERVGFDKLTTAGALADLREFAAEWVPALGSAPMRASWAGLRPGCAYSSPVLGRPEGWQNLWLAVGHFRKGIQLAPGTAALLADWIEGKPGFSPESSFCPSADRTTHLSSFCS